MYGVLMRGLLCHFVLKGGVVPCAASCSPASLDDRVAGVARACIWGCQALGTWEHIAWECGRRPAKLAPPPWPTNEVTARWGWAVKSERVGAAQAWLVEVQRRLWSVTRL